MAIPTLVIVGRPNVGKSTLFNALVGERIAIVDPTAGVTRDRVSSPLEVGEGWVELVDTGGIGAADAAELSEDVHRQIEIALREADVILFVVDAKDGILAPDEDIARRLRRLERKVVLVANKVEGGGSDFEAPNFYSLGFGDVSPVSAKNKLGLADLLERIQGEIPEVASEEPEEEGIRLAIVGRMNAGKSTLVNHLVGEDRVIVSERPGTTRDAVDVPFERNGQKFIAVDTAGIRKLRIVSGTPDFYAQDRSERAIRRADVVLFMLDATRQIESVDRRIADVIVDSARPCVLCLSKWDLIEDRELADFEKYVAGRLPMLKFAPMCLLSTKDEIHVDGTLGLVHDLYEQAGLRATTGELNRILQQALTERSPKAPRGRGGKIPKVYYMTQADIHPPTMVVFVNEPGLFSSNYVRYLSTRFRETGPFTEIPVKVFLKRRHARSK